ncbi:MAG: beta strand repeat-containing protein, partial [Candidatus Dormibacteria bacterium]
IFRILVGLACVVGSTPFLVSPVHASSQDLYISTSGSNTSNCTNAATPCESLSYALTQASSGATITIEGSAYMRMTAGASPIFITSNLSPINLVGEGSISPTLSPTPAELDTSNAVGMFVNTGTTVSISNLTFDAFITQDVYNGGGVLYIDKGANVTVTNCTFNANTAKEIGTTPSSTAYGGAILNQGTLTISGSTLHSNVVMAPSSISYPGLLEGGAIYNGGTATITNSVIDNNALIGEANEPYKFWGAGIANAGTLSISGSTIYENHVSDATAVAVSPTSAEGGGIFNTGTVTSIRDSEIVQNALNLPATSIALGAGIYNNYDIDEIAMSTIYENELSSTNTNSGAGIYSASTGFGTQALLYLAGSVIASNTIYANTSSSTYNCTQYGTSSSIVSLGYNVSDTSDCNLNQPTDQPNTQVVYSIHSPNSSGNNVAITPLAPYSWAYAIPLAKAITFGPTQVLLCPGVDQAGHARPVPGETQCSAGSVEPGTTFASPTPPSFTSASSATFIIDTNSSFTLTASGNPTPIYTITSSSQPPSGVTLNPATGQLSGIASTYGTYPFTVEANNGFATVSEDFTLNVVTIPTTIQAEALATKSTVVFAGYAQSSNTSFPAQGTLTFAANTSGGGSSGTCSTTLGGIHAGACTIPLQSLGASPISLTATFSPTNPTVSASASSSFGTIQNPSSTLPSATLTGTVGEPVTSTVAEQIGGTAPITWSTGTTSLPPGLILNTSTGNISGTPATVATGTFTVTATDAGTPALVASIPVTYTIGKGTPQLMLSAASSVTVGSSVAVKATVTGGGSTPTGSVAITLGTSKCTATLAAGTGTCQLQASSSGSLTMTGTYSGDGNYTTASSSLPITVNAAPTPTP